jgi:hypothetical protein
VGLASGLRVGLIAGLAYGLGLGLVGGLLAGTGGEQLVGLGPGIGLGLTSELSIRLATGLGIGLGVGLVVGLAFGGFACVQHLVLRALLVRAGHAPWDYVRFRNYAADHVLLRQVGGAYEFIHPLLLEHLAAMPSQPSEPKASTDRPKPSQPVHHHAGP